MIKVTPPPITQRHGNLTVTAKSPQCPQEVPVLVWEGGGRGGGCFEVAKSEGHE